MNDGVQAVDERNALGRSSAPPSLLRRLLRSLIHRLSYTFIYSRRRTRVARAAGFRLTVRPTVFHPGWFITSEFFAAFIASLDLKGLTVADVGTGSGILAMAAARAGAAGVVAVDVNPNAVQSAAENAAANGLGDRVEAVRSDLLAALPSETKFDVIITSPPSFPGEPLDLADRAWHAGPEYRDIAALFEQARDRLAPGGRVFMLVSSDSDLDRLGVLAGRAGFSARLVAEKSILIEELLIYELRLKDEGHRDDRAPVSQSAPR